MTMSKINLISKYLKNSQLFSNWDKDSLQTICTVASLKNCIKGELIFCENDPAHSL